MAQKTFVRLTLSIVLFIVLFITGCGSSSKPKEKPEVKSEQTLEMQTEEKQMDTQATQEQKQTVQEVQAQAEAKDQPEKEAKVTEPVQAEQKEENKQDVDMELKFKPDTTCTYKLTTRSEKSVMWEGPEGSKPTNFKGGHTGSNVDMTFEQKVESVNEQKNGILLITIKSLKYMARVKDNVVLNFDSTNDKDKNDPMMALIGQSYTIEMTDAGQVIRVIEVSKARAAIKGSSPAAKAAQTLLSDDVIKERHAIPALPTGEKKEFAKGDTWSTNKSFNFGMMGPKSYERQYELKEIKKSGDAEIAVAEMNAIPSTAQAKELHKTQATSAFSKMFDNTETYTGELKLNLETGIVQEFSENLKTEWLAVDPSYSGDENTRPNALRMTAFRVFDLKKID